MKHFEVNYLAPHRVKNKPGRFKAHSHKRDFDWVWALLWVFVFAMSCLDEDLDHDGLHDQDKYLIG